MSLLERVVPRHLQIIYEINRRFLADAGTVWRDEPERLERVSIVQEGYEVQVRMAHLAIVGSHSVNGVSKLHTELVKTRLVPDFYQLWPERFSNKTNGVTQRRWLLMANPGLASLLDATIGAGWATDLAQLSAVEKFADDAEFQRRFRAIKRANKERLARIVNRLAAVDVDPAGMFDIQAKRIHEYKRQLLMALGIVHQYLRLVDDGVEPPVPRTYLLAGKAAPGYWAAKMIIKLINSLGEVINNDPKTRELIKVAFLPDYRVSLAEKIIPAADVSEQISTAGREASGTGNMKFAMNGALTVGTLDGANIEIREAVGAENIFIFGLTSGQIEELALKGEYRPRDYYEADPRLKRVLDELASDRFCPGEPGLFRWVRDALVNRDDYFLMADFGAYIDIQSRYRLSINIRRSGRARLYSIWRGLVHFRAIGRLRNTLARYGISASHDLTGGARGRSKIADATQLFGNFLHHCLRQAAERPKQPPSINRARLIDHHLARASVAGHPSSAAQHAGCSLRPAGLCREGSTCWDGPSRSGGPIGPRPPAGPFQARYRGEDSGPPPRVRLCAVSGQASSRPSPANGSSCSPPRERKIARAPKPPGIAGEVPLGRWILPAASASGE